jgi:hypothetical protein
MSLRPFAALGVAPRSRHSAPFRASRGPGHHGAGYNNTDRFLQSAGRTKLLPPTSEMGPGSLFDIVLFVGL